MQPRPAITLLVAAPLLLASAAAADTPAAVLLDLKVERDGEPVFSPRMRVRLGQMAEASSESPSGEGHRIVLSVNRDGDVLQMRSLYLTRHEKAPWVVAAEPHISLRESTAGSMALFRGDHELYFGVKIGSAFTDPHNLPFPDTPAAALVELAVERDGERVFSPRMLVRLGQMAEASSESPSGEGHRIVLSVNRDGDRFRMRSLYLTRQEDKPWTVVAEPNMSLRDASAGSMALVGEDQELRFGVEIGVGTFIDLYARLFPDATAKAGQATD